MWRRTIGLVIGALCAGCGPGAPNPPASPCGAYGPDSATTRALYTACSPHDQCIGTNFCVPVGAMRNTSTLGICLLPCSYDQDCPALDAGLPVACVATGCRMTCATDGDCPTATRCEVEYGRMVCVGIDCP